MASIDKRPDGRYRARWREYPTGPQKVRHFARKRDAERFLDAIRGNLAHGVWSYGGTVDCQSNDGTLVSMNFMQVDVDLLLNGARFDRAPVCRLQLQCRRHGRQLVLRHVQRPVDRSDDKPSLLASRLHLEHPSADLSASPHRPDDRHRLCR